MDKPIARGEIVDVRTTNGGRSYNLTLHEDYVPTYAATFVELGRPIMAERIVWVRAVPKFELERRARYREMIKTETHEGPSGELLWDSNNAPVPADIFEEAGVRVPEGHLAALEAHTAKVIANYKRSRARRTPEMIEEERAEMRAAFGPGETVVNVITGERTRL